MLPKLDVPVFETKLISSNKPIKFRPFLVKEQKLFLMATQSEDTKEVVDVIKQVLNNCIITKDIDIDKLPIFDIEYLFLNLRSKSIGEIVELNYTCNNDVEKEGVSSKCGNTVKVKIDLNSVSPITNKNHNNKIELSDSMGIVMKYPTFEIIERIHEDNIFDMIIDCVDFIYDKDNIYYSKDVERQELTEFIENLQQSDFEKIENFFKTMPKLEKDLLFKCNKCEYEENIHLEGVQNFFG